MSIIKQVTLQKIVAHDFRYDPRTTRSIVRIEQNSRVKHTPGKHALVKAFSERTTLCAQTVIIKKKKALQKAVFKYLLESQRGKKKNKESELLIVQILSYETDVRSVKK